MSLSPEDQAALTSLSGHWEGAYVITVPGGTWTATRADDGEQVTAGSWWELREAIIADYSARPVPRRRPLSAESQRRLGFMQAQYGAEYAITAVPGNWTALHRDGGAPHLEAGSAAMLAAAINTDLRERARRLAEPPEL